MKLKQTLALLLLLAAVSVKGQTNWVKQALDNRVAVKFPAAPQPSAVNGGVRYQLKDKDSVIYSAILIDLKVAANLDSAKLAPLKDMPEFAEGMKTGLGKSLPGVDFGTVTMGTWQGQSSYTFSGSTAKKTIVYGNIVLIGSKVYFLAAMVPDGVATKTKDDFFATLELTK